jgi:hypothetical protein
MNIPELLQSLDAEIKRLQQVHALLSESEVAPKRRGRPPGSGQAASGKPAKPKKRKLSPEGRKRIIGAQRKRHAKANAVTVKRVPAKAAPKKRDKKAAKRASGALSGKSGIEAVAAQKVD